MMVVPFLRLQVFDMLQDQVRPYGTRPGIGGGRCNEARGGFSASFSSSARRLSGVTMELP